MPDETPDKPLEGESDFWEDAGPGFDPEFSPEAPELADITDTGEPAGWTPEQVITVLQEMQAPAFNGGVNPMLGVEKVDWKHRPARLEVVAPAIAREWNKVPFLRSLAGTTDRALIASYLAFEYIGPRAIQVSAERKQIARRRQVEAEAAEYEAQRLGSPTNVSGSAPDDAPQRPDVDLGDIPPRRR